MRAKKSETDEIQCLSAAVIIININEVESKYNNGMHTHSKCKNMKRALHR